MFSGETLTQYHLVFLQMTQKSTAHLIIKIWRTDVEEVSAVGEALTTLEN